MTSPTTRDALAERIESLKFDARQGMIEYGIATRKDDQEGILVSTAAAVKALDELGALATQDAASGQGWADKMHFAVLQACSICNQSMDMARSADGRRISDILRQSLVDAADAALNRASQPTEPAQQPEAPARTSERHFALREAHHIEAESAFFAARPALDSSIERQAFAYGFTRGFDAAEKCYPAALTQAQAEQPAQQEGQSVAGEKHEGSCWRQGSADCGC